jgi:hypothetical protein
MTTAGERMVLPARSGGKTLEMVKGLPATGSIVVICSAVERRYVETMIRDVRGEAVAKATKVCCINRRDLAEYHLMGARKPVVFDHAYTKMGGERPYVHELAHKLAGGVNLYVEALAARKRSSPEEMLLRRLVEAEDRGCPLTHAQLGMETQGSTFEDLWADMRVVVKGRERQMVCAVGPDSQYVASAHGRWWLAKRDAERSGAPVPPAPAPEGVYL